MKPGKKGLLLFGVSFVSVVVVIVGLEIGTRILRPGVKFVHYMKPSRLFNHGYTPNFDGKYTGPEGYEFRQKMNAFGLNQYKRVVVPKPENIYRVLIVGDSFIAGLGNITVPNIIGDWVKLRVAVDNRIVEIVNAGQSSYSPILHIARFKHQLQKLEPDAIIFFPDLTDVYDDWHRYRKYAVFDKNGMVVRVNPSTRLVKYWENMEEAGYSSWYSFFAKYIYRRFFSKSLKRLAGKSGEERIFQHAQVEKDAVTKKAMTQIMYSVSNISNYLELLESKQIHVSVAIYPHLPQITGKFNRLYEQEIRKLSFRKKIPFKSFFKEIATEINLGRKLYFKGDIHFSNIGLGVLGRYVKKWIAKDPVAALGIKFK